jgi:phenylalanyl-tRNA synthetase alpha chain
MSAWAWLGKKGRLTAELKTLGNLPPEQRREMGQGVNALKRELAEAVEARREALERAALDQRLASETVDVTLPGRAVDAGGPHPVSRAMRRIIDIFRGLGFEVADGPEVEDDYYNFEALNFPGASSRRGRCTTRSTCRTAACCGRTPRRSRSG